MSEETMGDSNKEDEDFVENDRVRLFPLWHQGPYTVFIREIGNNPKLKPVTFAAYLHKKCKSVQSVVTRKNKMEIVFNDIAEANIMIADNKFEHFKVFLRAEEVEVVGAISFSDLCDIEQIEDLKKKASGRFENPERANVKILDVHRFKNGEELTNTVKITFEGRVLPKYVVIYGLLVKVRSWYQRAMFCERCLRFQHTSKYCNNKMKCANCSGEHLTATCAEKSIVPNLCPYCENIHDPGRKHCELFKKVDSDFFKHQKDKYEQSVSRPRITTPNTEAMFHAVDFPPIFSKPLSSPRVSPSLNNAQVKVKSVFDSSQPSGSSGSNYYDILNQDLNNSEIIEDSRPSKPKLLIPNPWSHVVRQRVQKRKIGSQNDPPKRRAASIVRADMPSTSTCTVPSTSSRVSQPPGFATNQSDTCADTLMSTLSQIIAQVFTAMNIPDHWKNLCLTLLPIVLGAIKTYMSTSSISIPSSSNNVNQNV